MHAQSSTPISASRLCATSLPREILRTNKSGAYHCTSIVDCNTRKYHGLLVIPVPNLDDENHVLLSSLDETVDDSLAQAEGYIRRLGEEWSIPELARLLAEGGLPSYEGYAPAWLRRLLVDYAHREEKIYGAFLRQLAKGPDPGLEYRLRERAAQDNLDLRLLSFMYILDR